jgi:hypothetical protein
VKLVANIQARGITIHMENPTVKAAKEEAAKATTPEFDVGAELREEYRLMGGEQQCIPLEEAIAKINVLNQGTITGTMTVDEFRIWARSLCRMAHADRLERQSKFETKRAGIERDQVMLMIAERTGGMGNIPGTDGLLRSIKSDNDAEKALLGIFQILGIDIKSLRR